MMKVVPTRVGEGFQAEIPALLSAAERAQEQKRGARPASRAQWAPAAFGERELAEYLRCTRLNETEAALHCLYASGFDVDKASQLLASDRQRRARSQRQQLAALSDEAFEAAVAAHGKRFSVIQQHYPAAKISDLIARFYKWKTSTSYKKWHERAKAKKNKEAARLRQWADAEDSELSDFHNEYCELCCTGGQLLCCDGCERAYHFSCVDPPIKDVPMGDWFCAACAKILGTKCKAQASKENPFCDEFVVRESPTQADDIEHQDDIEDDVDDHDDEVATDGNDTDEIEDSTMDDDLATISTPVKRLAVSDDRVVVKREPVAIKQEPVVYQRQQLYTPERPRQFPQAKRALLDSDARTPTRSPLLLESTNRKRQRKTGAPRRILQSGLPNTS